MTIAWLGVALLSVSWLFGLGYYHPVNWSCCAALIVLAVCCFLTLPAGIFPRWRSTGAALLLSTPALFVAPWPYRGAILLLVVGLLLRIELLTRHFPRRLPALAQRLSIAAIVTGSLLLVQSLAISWYTRQTALSHELPPPLPQLLGAIARLLGIDSAVQGNTIVLHSMREIHHLGATWELLLDPATFCFLVATIAILCWQYCCALHYGRSPLWSSTIGLGVSLLLWLPLRAGIFMALYLHDVLRTPYDAHLDAMRLFWNGWLHLLLLAGPVLLCSVFAPRTAAAPSGHADPPVELPAGCWRPRLLAAIAIGLAVNLIAVGIFWDPVGTRQQGRVLVEEHHPDPEEIWEPTFKPYDTKWYGNESGYNYYCIYDYCSRFYSMSRRTEPIDESALSDCDVLIVKVPTRPFAPAEIRCIRDFVAGGGGLLLIGEHTNVFRSGDYLNPIARIFGFEFRYDCLFGIDSVYEQRYDPPLVPHPIVQNLAWLDLAVSCSIQPGAGRGRGVIVDTGLKNMIADYHSDNFYPIPTDRADMRYGSFVQLWATRYGKGRVVAFSDSTIFSNFCVFEPGKAELMLGMVEWLNHRSWIAHPRPLLFSAGSLLMLAGFFLARRREMGLLLVASALLGWSVAVVAVRAAHQVTMPPPAPSRELVQVVVDRTLCDCPLAKNGFVDGSEDGMGIFERWIHRLGYFTARRQGQALWDADLVIFLLPRKPISTEMQRQMVDYIGAGGKVLIVDSARTDSTSNELLRPFGVSIDHSRAIRGQLESDWPAVPIDDAAVVQGGEPFAWISDQPVGTLVREGRGSLAVVGFGSRFSDVNMGVTGDVIPDAELMRVFQLQFDLLRWFVESQ